MAEQTLEQKIKKLNWFNYPNEVKEILLEMMERIEVLENA